MRGTSATLVLPVLTPRRLAATLVIDAKESTWVTFRARGERIGEALVGPQAVAVTLDIAEERLVRGDNRIELHSDKGAAAMPRLLRLEFGPARSN
jgi:hypothetical protein